MEEVMLPSSPRLSIRLRLVSLSITLLTFLAGIPSAQAQSAYVRVSQVGYEAGKTPFRAYLMSTERQSGATFKVVNSKGATVYSGHVGSILGTWSHSKKVTYYVYALDFTFREATSTRFQCPGQRRRIRWFAVDWPDKLYSGLLLNTLFFYETQRDGANFIPNALRTEPGHLKDGNAQVYQTPPLDTNDFIDNLPPAPPLVSAKLPNIDASGGWWDAGDYVKYVETTSYTAALMQIGIRDFPNQMGAYAPVNPPAPPGSLSFAGNSGPGAPASSDFTDEASFGIDWLMKMWNDKTRTLYYQVDNTQDWDYYGEGDPSSATGNCGGTYPTPYCLITEYDIWTLPQAADNYDQAGDPQPCDPFTTFFICNRPVYVAGPAGSPISPNLAGRLAADFRFATNSTAPRTLLARINASRTRRTFSRSRIPHFRIPLQRWIRAPAATVCSLSPPLTVIPKTCGKMTWNSVQLNFISRCNPLAEPRICRPDCCTRIPWITCGRRRSLPKITSRNIYDAGYTDTLNLYDVSGLAHFELYRALEMAGDPGGLAVSQSSIRQQFLQQVQDAITQAGTDPWGFGYNGVPANSLRMAPVFR